MYIKNIMKGVNNMKLVVGLGNPGDEYSNTRHNIGFMFLDYLFDSKLFSLNKKFKAYEYETLINGEKFMLIKPITYMNLSGETVLKYVNYYKIQTKDILVIQDDLDMETGRYKLMFNHGDGGHNGIKNIVSLLNSKEFLRLKIGISKADINTKDYVLGNFSKTELDVINKSFSELKNFLNDYTSMSLELLMGKYNTKEKNNN